MKKFLGKAVLSAALVSALPQMAHARLNPVLDQTGPPATVFEPGHLPFTVTLRDDLAVDLETFAVFAHPGEQIRIRSDRPLSWIEGETSRPASAELDWTAPVAQGLTRVRLEDEDGNAMQLNLVVMRHQSPDDGETINGYRLGSYPSEPYLGHENYRAPESFLEVSEGLEDLAVSPHFRLGQFLCKQPANGGPQYLVLSERLLVKLERILEAANERGWRTDGFNVMSGYRTPAYNASIGNGANSRHIFGGAADIFIDTDGDGVMDDLNGDGVNDRQDAAALFDLVESLSQDPAFAGLAGGLGEYAPNAHHGPFVHVDERGWNVQWGRSTR